MQRTSLFVPRWLRAARLLALGLLLAGLALSVPTVSGAFTIGKPEAPSIGKKELKEFNEYIDKMIRDLQKPAEKQGKPETTKDPVGGKVDLPSPSKLDQWILDLVRNPGPWLGPLKPLSPREQERLREMRQKEHELREYINDGIYKDPNAEPHPAHDHFPRPSDVKPNLRPAPRFMQPRVSVAPNRDDVSERIERERREREELARLHQEVTLQHESCVSSGPPPPANHLPRGMVRR